MCLVADHIHCRLKAEFKKAYPDAKVIGVQAMEAKLKPSGLTLDGGVWVLVLSTEEHLCADVGISVWQGP